MANPVNHSNTVASTITLAENISSSDLSFDVSDASSFPSTPFRIEIDSEVMKVTGVASNTLTVTRGDAGTSAASHTSGAPVRHVVVAQDLHLNLGDHEDTSLSSPAEGDMIFRNDSSQWVKVGGTKTDGNVPTVQSDGTIAWEAPPVGAPWAVEPGLKPPTSPHGSDLEFSAYANGTNPTAGPGMTWGNQGSSTASIDSGRLVVVSEAATGLRALLLATPGSGNIKVAARVAAQANYQYPGAQLVFLWGTPASPTRVESCGFYGDNTGSTRLNWTNYGTGWTPTADRAAASFPSGLGNRLYARVDWNGTDLLFYASPSAVAGTWVLIYTATLGLGRPDYVGLGVNPNSSNVVIGEFPFLRFDWAASDFDPTV